MPIPSSDILTQLLYYGGELIIAIWLVLLLYAGVNYFLARG